MHRIVGNVSHPTLDLVSLERRGAALHQQLQSFLDAQAAGLSAEFESPSQIDDRDLDEGVTLTSQTLQQRKIVPVRQPPSNRVSLRAARRGIRVAMQELCEVKRDELDIIDTSIRQNRSVANKVDEWENKRKSLEAEICLIGRSQAGSRVQQLQERNKALQEEVEALELQLSDLRLKHKAVQRELSSLTNSVQSKVSSYEASRQILDRQIREFLSRPVEQLPGVDVDPAYSSLPPRRRTIEMVQEQTQQTESILVKRKATIENEKAALEQGVEVWSAVIAHVNGFEGHLARCLKSSNFSTDHHDDMNDNTERLGSTKSNMADIESKFAQVVAYLEKEVQIAEKHGWKLLLCGIGAEVEALVQGHEILIRYLA